MTKNILFIDEKWQVAVTAIVLEHKFDLQVSIVESLDEAVKLLDKSQYHCVLVEPFDYQYLGKERNSPFLKFILDMKAKEIPLIISSSYTETDFRRRFGLLHKEDYAGYLGKPWIVEEFNQELERVLSKNDK